MYTATISFSYSASGTSSAAGYYLSANITAVTGFSDKNLFLLQSGVYAGVCTVIDLDNISLVEDSVTKFVRANNFSVWCATADERTALKTAIAETMTFLCKDKANTVSTSTEVVVVSQ